VSDMTDRLHAAMDGAPMRFRSVFRHAIALAKEADHLAARASNEVQCGISPAYPPLVELLAETMT